MDSDLVMFFEAGFFDMAGLGELVGKMQVSEGGLVRVIVYLL